MKLVQTLVLMTALGLFLEPMVAGQEKITGHHGITPGMGITDLKDVLKRNPCISKTQAGEPVLERVPLKPYYRTYCKHSSKLNSEITFWIDVEKGVEQIRESFGGEAISSLSGARQEFAKLKQKLSKTWGKPKQDNEDLVVWRDRKHAAILRVIPPDHPLSLPILKVVISTQGLASEEMQKTLAGRVF